MAFWNRLKGKGEARTFVTFDDIGGTPTYAGVSVTQDTSVNLPAVYRCVSLNAEVVSSLPIDFLVKRGGNRIAYEEPLWYRHPNDEQDFAQFLGQIQASLELDGNAFILKAVTASGRLDSLYVLAPSAVIVERSKATGEIVYRVQKTNNQVGVFGANEVLHIPAFTLPGALRGLSPIACARQTIGTGFAAEQYGAMYFGSGATLSGIIKVPFPMKQEDSERLQENFKRRHGGVSKSHAIGVLAGGADWVPMSVNPEESQFLQTRRFTDVQIANLFGIPADYVTETEGAKGYVSGIYVRQFQWLTTGINPRLSRLERAFSSLLPGNAYMHFNRNAFLQMDPGERTSFYTAGLRDRWLTPNEVRAFEDMNPLPEGDELLESVQYFWESQEQPEADLSFEGSDQ